MREIVNQDRKKHLGLQIFMVGFLLAAIGFAVALAGLQKTGWLTIWVGGTIGALGLAVHAVMLWKDLLGKK